MKNILTNYLWVDKYAPKTLSEVILSPETKDIFTSFIENETFPSMILTGPPGIGKTVAAKALCNDLGCDLLFKNASLNGLIDDLRNQVHNYCSTASFSAPFKVVFFDEADGMNNNSFEALRGFIENFKHCRFIFSCNNITKIPDYIKSRTTTIEFTRNKTNEIFKRLMFILKSENVTCSDVKLLVKVYNKYNGDLRRIIIELQKYAQKNNNVIDSGIITNVDIVLDEFFQTVKSKKFNDIRKWVSKNNELVTSNKDILSRKIYEYVVINDSNQVIQEDKVPEFIVMLSDYLYQSNFVVDQEIAFMAFIVNIMEII